MPRPYTQSRSCANIDGENYVVPIIGDMDGLRTVTERSYTYLLRNANPRLRPSQFRRETVDKVFHFMIERLRKVRNTNTKQVMKYGVQNFLALLTDVEKKNCRRFCPGPRMGARFSRANPGLGGTVPPELIKVAFDDYISRIVPKPGSTMRSIFFEQFGQQLGKQCAHFPKASPEPKENTMNLSSPPEKAQGTGNQPGNRSDNQSDDESDRESESQPDSGNENEPSPAEDESQPKLEKDSDSEDEAPETASEASGTCSNVGMGITCDSGNLIKVPQISDQSDKAGVKVAVALRSTPESKAVKRARSPSVEAVSEKDQNLVADESKTRPKGGPKHKRLKIGGNFSTDSDNDKEASAKPLPQSSHKEDCIPEPETGAKLVSERVSSLDSKIEDSPPSETGTGLEARADKNPPVSKLSILSSHLGEDICLVENLAHTLQSASASISVIKNNAAISKPKLLVHPDNNAVGIQDGQLSQPITEGLDLPVLASHNSTSSRPHPTEICTIPDMLTGLGGIWMTLTQYRSSSLLWLIREVID